MTMMAYWCTTGNCRVLAFKASAATAKCPACNRTGEFTGKIGNKHTKKEREVRNG